MTHAIYVKSYKSMVFFFNEKTVAKCLARNQAELSVSLIIALFFWPANEHVRLYACIADTIRAGAKDIEK